ncbi:hypothetical protein ACJRO7_002011 [Eucalyptus globulus]|uniref:Uncharacterized protein n=1 Tax=Eucalyptus globulus TaxID=34317 RepID=A0ABD3M2S6_EUCGL
MGERKVLNKYYRPGFDPSELPRFGRPKSGQIKNSVYIVELGVIRNFEPRRKQDEVTENEKEESRQSTVDVDAILEVLQGTSAAKENKLEEEDEVLLKSIVLHTSKDFVRRIEDEDFKEEEDLT